MSDKEDYELVLRIIESRLYDNLPNEVPYNLKVELEYYEVSREGNFSIQNTNRCTMYYYNYYIIVCFDKNVI